MRGVVCIGYLLLAVLMTACTASRETSGSSVLHFDLNRLNAEGLQGPPDGLRALHYEYCIPDRPELIDELAGIDPSLETQYGSPGRIGCGEGELLCLGHTHQPDYREVLERLGRHPMVGEIREALFE